jgi:hypothetical protein
VSFIFSASVPVSVRTNTQTYREAFMCGHFYDYSMTGITGMHCSFMEGGHGTGTIARGPYDVGDSLIKINFFKTKNHRPQNLEEYSVVSLKVTWSTGMSPPVPVDLERDTKIRMTLRFLPSQRHLAVQLRCKPLLQGRDPRPRVWQRSWRNLAVGEVLPRFIPRLWV